VQGSAVLGAVVDDPLLFDDGGWLEEAIINTAEGATTTRALLASPQEVPLAGGLGAQWSEGADFLGICAAVLLQLNVELAWVATEHIYTWRCVARGPRATAVGEELMLFPPLFFIPYEGSDLLVTTGHAINTNHPFAGWLQSKAVVLSEHYPGILSTLRGRLSDLRSYSADDDALEQIRGALDRLRQLDRDLAPPPSAVPTKADIA
jgi:hypothetical protein